MGRGLRERKQEEHKALPRGDELGEGTQEGSGVSRTARVRQPRRPEPTTPSPMVWQGFAMSQERGREDGMQVAQKYFRAPGWGVCSEWSTGNGVEGGSREAPGVAGGGQHPQQTAKGPQAWSRVGYLGHPAQGLCVAQVSTGLS